MSTHNICFLGEMRKILCGYPLLSVAMHDLSQRLDIMRQTACLVVNPIIVDGYASLFNCMTAVWASDSMTAS